MDIVVAACSCLRDASCCATRRPSDSGQPDPQDWNAPQHIVQELSNEALLFLLASRYCEVDGELKEFAGKLFNSTPPGWPRVQSICNFVYQHIRFDDIRARANRTALEAFRDCTGVCRDCSHLAFNALPPHEHFGPLLHRLSWRYRRTTVN